MTTVFDAPWFYWAVGVAVGLPICLVLLTELHNALLRRNNVLARPVHLLRNYILPLGALLILLVQGMQISGETTPVRIVATVFGFVVLVLLLSGLNATLFQGAPEGTWRKRIPSIFLDVARFVLIAVGVGLIFAYIWGANVGGLFAALGVSSIVLGLALQNSVGQIISGLLVLFEQPFQLGDWIETPSGRGRVVEVNWRATHIDTGGGMLIMPNSVLAAASFTNFSRPPGTHSLSVDTVFAVDDPPDDVIAMLEKVAAMLPQLRPDATPSSVHLGGLRYSTSIPLTTPADDYAAKTQFLRWVWYASRRAGLHLDEAEDEFETPERLQKSVRIIAPTLRLNKAEQEAFLPHVRLARYGTHEYLQYAGEVPKRMLFVVTGTVRLVVTTSDGATIAVRTLEAGDFLGQTTLTREPVTASAYALEEVTVLLVERAHIEELTARKPVLLQDFGHAIEERRSSVQRAVAAAGE
ncbi:Small-conductance mechanosensitive channel [Mycolicibacterium rutilum]|uniref:Small-conductance mechanosensitive channel n=1 Tax=Mycolicibacterium rutilum TaxID=370526 RepID=A0A1H6KRD7_MYCRU|nr:mechanosensitive ion channel family protein [Mycolicibacterium rutilum]SEH78358.1 Small-conductance mechanosensitive channel [Mycolicibacterium rutilum]